MSIQYRTNVSLPLLTNTGLQTKCTIHMGGSDAYQMLPDPVLAVRTPLVDLVWSPPPLPTLTTVPIWLAHHYVVLLPIITGRGLNTHTMIATVIFYILIVGLVAYASYLRHQLKK